MRDKMNIVLKEHHKKLLEVFFYNSYDGIYITDKEGNLILTNPATINLLDTSYEELIGNKVQDIISRGYYDGSPALESAKTGKVITGLVQVPNGTQIMSTSRPIFNENGEIELIITNCRPLNCIEEFYKKLNTERNTNIKVNTDQLDTHLIFKSKIMKDLISNIKMLSKTDTTIIIYGRSGTGKSVLAKFIHENSNRVSNQFVEINCAAIPENLMESELFGYEKGAFTGANKNGKLGLFEIADGGIIFLDEIGEMPLALQAKLLKVLDSGYIRRVGGTLYHKVNVRIIVATNKDLKKLVENKAFREDLFYRLNVIPITVPSLKERKEDIINISLQFLDELNNKYHYKKTLSDNTMNTFLNYPWPGNIRQLRNVIERLYITTIDSNIDVTSIANITEHETLNIGDTESINSENFSGTLKDYMSQKESEYIFRIIEECNGSITEASKKLGIHRTALHKKIKKV
ncbi:MAG: sigma 54-interacting transcriptional regulator [Clostridia bacterium]|nr:sigma 54-interacting transcriptional regulator [Clostridia bacterium]